MATIHTLFVLGFFGGALLLNSPESYTGDAVRIVVTWVLSFSGSALLSLSAIRYFNLARGPVVAPRMTNAHVLVAFVLVAVQIALGVTGQLGYEAQVETGLSTPLGLLGTIASLAQPWVLLCLAIAVRTGQSVFLASLAAVGQVIALSLQGFRGSSVHYMVWLLVVLWILASNRKLIASVGGRVLSVSVGVIVAISGFWFATIARSDAADRLGVASSGTQLLKGGWLETILSRIDMMSYLEVGVRAEESSLAQQAVSWSNYAFVLIPRAIFPEKPIVNYGQDVTTLIYGEDYQSSSTISWLGDAYLNVGELGILLLAIIFGGVLVFSEKMLPRRSLIFGWTALVAIVIASTNLESSLLLMAFQVVRTVMAVSFLWWLITWLSKFAVVNTVPNHAYGV
ncbi:MAG: hypothetical protein V7706_12005 [Dietzia psychralcaliphila]